MFKAITQITSLVLLASMGSAHASTPNPYQELAQKSYPYDLLYPLYAIECGVTQYNKIKDTGGVKANKGGSFGHSVIYLKNVCRDTSVDYPKIRKCAPGEKDLSSPEGGMTLSLDKNFLNTRYIPTDGLDMMLNGVSEDDQALTAAQEDATVQKLLASGAARGIKLTKAVADQIPAGMSDEEWALRNVVSSSFAIRFGRNSRCVSTPINEKMLDAAIDWVNIQNEPFVTGKKQYHWSMASSASDTDERRAVY
jgi:hypothetical protein